MVLRDVEFPNSADFLGRVCVAKLKAIPIFALLPGVGRDSERKKLPHLGLKFVKTGFVDVDVVVDIPDLGITPALRLVDDEGQDNDISGYGGDTKIYELD